MASVQTLDTLVRTRLRTWPQRPPGYPVERRGRNCWFRGRPAPASERYNPFLKLAGSNRLRTLPDGLWLAFGGSPVEIFVDIFAVEACATVSNLLDKRSRFAPSTHSLLAVCPIRWLLGHADKQNPIPRWREIGLLRAEPVEPLIVPVRDIRVMYALQSRHYAGFVATQVPHPHEYFVPMDALTAEDAPQDPAMRALVARAATSANFWHSPDCRVPELRFPEFRMPDLRAA